MTERDKITPDQTDKKNEVDKNILSEHARQSIFRMIMSGPPASSEKTQYPPITPL